MSYSYKLYKQDKATKCSKSRYRYYELIKMTTYQLREICIREKLIKNTISHLNKEQLIRLIMRYRGVDDSLLINTYEETSIEALQEFIYSVEKVVLTEKQIKVPAKLTVYEGLSVEIFDQYQVSSLDQIDEGNALLVDEAYKICAIFNIIKSNGDHYYLVKSKEMRAKESVTKHYSLLYFDKQQSELLYDIFYHNIQHKPGYIKFHQLPILDFNEEKLIETDIPLAIDFGTTNTTAGIYINKESFYLLDQNNTKKEDVKLNEISVIEVMDVTSEERCTTPLIPSVVGIKEIHKNEIEYVFGYEAIALSKITYVDQGICLFYDIKRWVSDYEREEKITDTNGQKTFIKRKDMIKAFMEYIINIACQRYKCHFHKIHISCPSKQKYKFYRLFKEILEGYDIEYENMLDEGVSVLFNTISEVIDKQRYENGEYYKTLIIDCGGGTTDLSSCEFRIDNTRVSYNIDIETSYENGDTDFGGNNLTFRIMQLLKIMIAEKIGSKKEYLKDKMITTLDRDLFRYVDENGVQAVYEELNTHYEKADSIIPTQFKIYEEHSSEDYFKVKSNFYMLFELADEIKKTLFTKPHMLQIIITPEKELEGRENYIVYDKWKLYRLIGDELKPMQDASEFALNIYELNTLLKADIYNLIRKFLDNIYQKDQLGEYAIIRLTGQSCKVELFRDALKEFIPGKVIQFRNIQKDKKENYDLKLACLKGALKYLQAKNFGYMNVNIHTKQPILPYVISAYTHTGEDKVLIHSLDKKHIYGHISRFMERIVLKLYLKDTNGNIRHEYEYDNRPEDFKRTTYEKIEVNYGKIISQDETDNIINEEVKFFVWARPKEWGFSVLPILRHEEGLYIGKEVFYLFENDEWETNFFDGLK